MRRLVLLPMIFWMLLTACGGAPEATPHATYTAAPTYTPATPYPTYTAAPTYTPAPTATPMPMPTDTPAPTAAPITEQAIEVSPATIPKTEMFTLHSSFVDDAFVISVSLPWRYEDTKTKTFPVLYMLDADVGFGYTAGVVQGLNLGYAFQEMIVVGIGYGADNLDDWELLRARDLTPVPYPGYPGSGGAKNFLPFLQEELIPHIEATYRANPSDRGLVGASAGGLFAVYALLNAPDTFNRYIAISPSLHWHDKYVFRYEEELAERQRELPVHLYLAAGSKEQRIKTDLEEFYQLLSDRGYEGLDMTIEVLEGETHGSMPIIAVPRALKVVY